MINWMNIDDNLWKKFGGFWDRLINKLGKINLNQKSNSDRKVVWIDLETTGVDAFEDKILEVACIVTDSEFNVIEEKEWIIKRDPELMKLISDEYVINMHEKTGLWNKLDDGVLEEEVDRQLFEMIRRAQPERKVVIGGNSVHFDKNFLIEHFELTGEILSHRVLDISAILHFMGTIGRKVQLPEHITTHEALDDIRWSIIQAKTVKDFVK